MNEAPQFDGWKEWEITNWRDGIRTAESVHRIIGDYEKQRARQGQQGRNVAWYNDTIAFFQWLLEQPRSDVITGEVDDDPTLRLPNPWQMKAGDT